MNSETWDNLANAITKLMIAYNALETDEAVKGPLISAVSDAMVPLATEKMGSDIMLSYLERYTGQLLGQAAGRWPTAELAAAHFDTLLDIEQPRIFETIRQFYPSGHLGIERFVMHSCERLRAAGHEEIGLEP